MNLKALQQLTTTLPTLIGPDVLNNLDRSDVGKI
jgi:hypothetical protein